ncbi:uncharacterized protein LOC111019324 isoform X2 [Momordica charantia]|uniref:Uncharacterized protein LOC111019324 isoform X2 n=1 Tax=Momordica charantia TaxID=3673 RepID=A0A6J1DCV6_MOMCH|nr:uncharacterized protein LOC111019324 isoform X2 [Momordica charantia]
MRIRKRQLSLPFSSLPLSSDSDPLPPVQLPCAAPHGDDPSPPPPHHNTAPLPMTLEEVDGDEEETREIARVFGAETSYGVVPQQSTSSPPGVVGKWCEREKAFPLKKRRGSFERPTELDDNKEEITTANSPEMIINKNNMKATKMNKKYATTSSPPQQKQEPEESKVGPELAVAGKKRSRGGALMEGSRCSRVNGRGWRCCQQTLVGYSLCEHHLGKGRLRSINTVRRRSAAAPKKEQPLPPPPLTPASKKRSVKLGVVKARSISSLLGQTDNVMAAPLYPLPHDDDV